MSVIRIGIWLVAAILVVACGSTAATPAPATSVPQAAPEAIAPCEQLPAGLPETSLTIIPPASEIAPALAAFSGIWEGLRGGQLPINLIVHQVTPTQVWTTYVRAGMAERMGLQVQADGSLQVTGGPRGTYTWTLSDDRKSLHGVYRSETLAISEVTMIRCAPPSPVASLPQAPVKPLPSLSEFQKGMAFGDWRDFNYPSLGLYLPPYTDQSLKDIAATGANWISLIVGCGQENVASTVIFCQPPRTATDAELRRVVTLAHELGMRVMLKPHLNFSNEPDTTRFSGHIGSAFTSEAQLQAWFESYRQFINHYATFSQDAGIDMLSIGAELGGTTHREEDWRRIIDEVRARFTGAITYASLNSVGTFPHGEVQGSHGGTRWTL